MARLRLDYDDDVFFYSTTLDVRFSDVNLGAHLGNDALVSYLTDVRSQFFAKHHVSEVGSVGTLMGDLAVVYKAEAHLRDVLRFDVGVADLARRGGDVVFRVVRESDDVVIAYAKTGMVFFDYEDRSVVDAPAAFVALFDR